MKILRVILGVLGLVGLPVTEPISAEVLESKDPAILLTHASVQFYKARRLFQANSMEEGTVIFKDIEQELQQALTLAQADSDAQRRAVLGGQAAHLLGDVYFHVLQDPDGAKAFYQRAIEFIPDHDGALEALKRFQ